MDAIHEGFIGFTGIPESVIESGSYSLAHGIAPGILSITTVPYAGPFPLYGNGYLQWDGRVVQIRDCKVDSCEPQIGGDGRMMYSFRILDRRWKWKFGYVEGHYNLRESDYIVRPIRIKTPQQMAVLCLRAMGEKRWDIRQLPNNEYPETHWELGNPAEMLAQLVESLGCRVVYNPFTDMVTICRVGEGQRIPSTSEVTQESLTIDPPELPESFTFLAGKTLEELEVLLEPVGEEEDGRVLPIDKLSYRPAAGWGNCDPASFTAVAPRYRERARRCIWRMWRPKLPFHVLGQQITEIEQILPLEDKRIEKVAVEIVEGKMIAKAAQERGEALLFGEFWDGAESISAADREKTIWTSRGPKLLYDRGFSIDTDRGIITTGEYLTQLVGPNGQPISGPVDPRQVSIGPAKLWLRTAFGVRDKDTGAWQRWSYRYGPKGKKRDTTTCPVHRDDVFLSIFWRYAGNRQPTKVDNKKEIEAAAKFYLAQELRNFQYNEPGIKTFRGFQLIQPDGAIQQITYTLDGSGQASTTISRNTEHSFSTVSYREARQVQQIRELLAAESGKKTKGRR